MRLSGFSYQFFFRFGQFLFSNALFKEDYIYNNTKGSFRLTTSIFGLLRDYLLKYKKIVHGISSNYKNRIDNSDCIVVLQKPVNTMSILLLLPFLAD